MLAPFLTGNTKSLKGALEISAPFGGSIDYSYKTFSMFSYVMTLPDILMNFNIILVFSVCISFLFALALVISISGGFNDSLSVKINTLVLLKE